MNRTAGDHVHDLESLLARTLFKAQYPLRSWDRSKGYLTANMTDRARKAMKASGIKNVPVEMEIVDPKEGAR